MTGDTEVPQVTTTTSSGDCPPAVKTTMISSALDVPSVTTRTLHGHCGQPHPLVRPGAAVVDWSAQCGLVAFACGYVVVVADPTTLQVVQTLEAPPVGAHAGSSSAAATHVIRLAWSKAPTARHAADRLTLAAAQADGRLLVYPILSAFIRSFYIF
jgi:hypothetical protein